MRCMFGETSLALVVVVMLLFLLLLNFLDKNERFNTRLGHLRKS